MGQFSNSFPKHFSYLCEYAIRFDLSCSYCEYPAIFHCLHCSPSCFDPDSLLLAYLWLGLSWIDCISANKSFSSSKTSSRKPYTSSKQQERQNNSAEITINFSIASRACGIVRKGTGSRSRRPPRAAASGDKRSRSPRTGSSREEQEGAATTPRTGTAREKRHGAKGGNVRGGTSSTSPHPSDRSGRSTKDDDTEEQRHRAEDEVEGMQSSKEVAGPRGSREVEERASPR